MTLHEPLGWIIVGGFVTMFLVGLAVMANRLVAAMDRGTRKIAADDDIVSGKDEE